MSGGQLAVAVFTASIQEAPGRTVEALLADASRTEVEDAVVALAGVLTGVLLATALERGQDTDEALATVARQFGLLVAKDEVRRG